MLISWANKPHLNGVDLGVNAYYPSTPEVISARASLVNDGWLIYDKGVEP
jgi:hypothetical protein